MVPILILVILSLLVDLLSSASAETDNFSPKARYATQVRAGE
jgi:hypothetical protein